MNDLLTQVDRMVSITSHPEAVPLGSEQVKLQNYLYVFEKIKLVLVEDQVVEFLKSAIQNIDDDGKCDLGISDSGVRRKMVALGLFIGHFTLSQE